MVTDLCHHSFSCCHGETAPTRQAKKRQMYSVHPSSFRLPVYMRSTHMPYVYSQEWQEKKRTDNYRIICTTTVFFSSILMQIISKADTSSVELCMLVEDGNRVLIIKMYV